jgi:molybdopterin biosynthesis enzyme
LRPYDLGALLASGHTEVTVKARPRVAIIPTGDEIVRPGAHIAPGRIIDFNSTVIAALVTEAGGNSTILPTVSDDLGKLKAALDAALQQHHLVSLRVYRRR